MSEAAQSDAAQGAGGLVVRGLTVRYDSVVAVDGIDLRVEPGEAVALLGANGAGKTSVLHAISRLVSAAAQEISFGGIDLRKAKPDAVARLGLGHVPEGRRVFPNLTVHENLQVGQSALSRRGRGVHKSDFSLDDVYALFPPLVPLRRRAGWALSGGEQQMVAVGRALVAGPRLLLLDEPSLGLAPAVVTTVFDALAQIVGRTTLLLVEQSTAAALSLCSRAYVLAQGSVVLAKSASELGDRAALLDSYLGQRSVTGT
ncbi:MAG: putative branched-chain amino acid transporter, ATP-binding protein [Mycobacterium sp.]|nr:putative branched-chain amino acid transporter, ATP-binding protein [Mycobacterium sp.]